VSFTTTILCVASQLVFIVVSVYFVTDAVLKLLDTPSYFIAHTERKQFFILCSHIVSNRKLFKELVTIACRGRYNRPIIVTIWAVSFGISSEYFVCHQVMNRLRIVYS
jgi:hypothetical protein